MAGVDKQGNPGPGVWYPLNVTCRPHGRTKLHLEGDHDTSTGIPEAEHGHPKRRSDAVCPPLFLSYGIMAFLLARQYDRSMIASQRTHWYIGKRDSKLQVWWHVHETHY